MSNSDLALNEQDKTEIHVVSSVSEDRGSRRLKGSLTSSEERGILQTKGDSAKDLPIIILT